MAGEQYVIMSSYFVSCYKSLQCGILSQWKLICNIMLFVPCLGHKRPDGRYER